MTCLAAAGAALAAAGAALAAGDAALAAAVAAVLFVLLAAAGHFKATAGTRASTLRRLLLLLLARSALETRHTHGLALHALPHEMPMGHET